MVVMVSTVVIPKKQTQYEYFIPDSSLHPTAMHSKSLDLMSLEQAMHLVATHHTWER